MHTNKPPEPTISSNAAKLVLRLASIFKIDLNQLFHDVDMKALDEPFNRLSLQAIDELTCRLQDATNDADLGLHIAEHVDIPMDLFNFIIFNSSPFELALKNICKYNALYQEFYKPMVTKGDKSVKISFQMVPGINAFKTFAEGYMAYYYKLFCRLLGKRIQLDRVDFIHSKPNDISEHLRIFDSTIYFGQKENSIWFPQDYLGMPVPVAHPELLSQLELHATLLLEKMSFNDTLVSQVERAILMALPRGNTDLDSISASLGYSPRSLQMKLKIEGTRYHDLLDSVKKERALQLLVSTKIPILDISYLLGYSEQSVFNRAFKRWTNLSPGEYRLQSVTLGKE